MIAAIGRIASKSIALLLLASVLFAAHTLIVEPLIDRYQSAHERIAEQRQLLGRYQSVASQDKGSGGVPGSTASKIKGGIFLSGSNDAIRIAEIQSLMSKLAQAEGIEVKSTRAVAPLERDDVRYLGVQVQLTASIGKLQRILFAIETHRPLLFVNAIQITPPPMVSADNPAPSAALDVHIDVAGASERKKG